MKKILIFLVVFGFLLCGANKVIAKTDLSISDSDITFSKETFFEGETIRIFARVLNIGDTDVYGQVIFLSNKKEIGSPQPISIKVGTYDDVFINWTFKSGNYNIEAKITGLGSTDDNPGNNQTGQKNIFVDLDSDNDQIGNQDDPDDDNDGLTDEREEILKTDPQNPDTDGDKVKDSVDVFPLDPAESRDTDNDGIGNNEDLDDDNDTLTDEQELFQYGTNPLNRDTDNDGLSDNQEVYLGTDPTKEDTDNDGVIDSEDSAPLDPLIGQAGLIGAIADWFKEKPYTYAIVGAIAMIIIFLIFRRKKN